MFLDRVKLMHSTEPTVRPERWTSASPFVPLSIAGAFPPQQQAQILEVYRIAAERTQAQLGRVRVGHWRIPQVSMN
jgi:hypothetical protein